MNNTMTEENTKEVKVLLLNGKYSSKRISEITGVKYHTVTDIKNGRTWKQIHPESLPFDEILRRVEG